MKRIYLIIFLFNALAFNSNAQKQWCNDKYVIDSIPYSPVQDFSTGTPLAFQFDTLSPVIPLGFNFSFYGNDFSSVVISPDGYLTFDLSQAGMLENSILFDTLPSPVLPHNMIDFLAATSYAGASTKIYYATIGTAPSRQFVVSFDSLVGGDQAFPIYTSTGQLVLDETSNDIEFYIRDLGASGVSGTIEGVQNSTGTEASALTGRDINQYRIQNDARRFTHTNLPGTAPSICMVSVDSASGKNVIIWDKSNALQFVDSFIIYKETNVAGVYSQIGSQPYSAFSTFIDAGSNPSQQANRYKIGYVDSCGTLSFQSNIHKTIHLSINKGIGNTWNLLWDNYQGFNYGSFNVYRGTSPTNLSLLATVASSLYSYTDLTPPVGPVYYLIGIDNPDPCTPARITGGGSFSSSISNIASSQVLGLRPFIDESSVGVSPNPANDELIVHFSSATAYENITISFTNIVGEIIKKEELKRTDDARVDISTLAAGIYFLQIKGDDWRVVKKLVKQ